MREENWHKMLMISAALHLVVIAALSFPIKKAFRKFDTSRSYYSVNLVGDIGPGLGATGVEKGKTIPPAKIEEVKPQKTNQKKPVPTRPTQEKDTRSLTPKKTEKPENASKADLANVEKRIREMKQRTGSTNVASARGTPGQSDLSGAGGAGGRLIDPALARYLVGVREKIENAWHIPFMSSQQKNLEVNATIKIRKDGRIVDITIDKRSGNRVYDESVLRALTAIQQLPPLPSSVTEDPLELELTLRPEGVS